MALVGAWWTGPEEFQTALRYKTAGRSGRVVTCLVSTLWRCSGSVAHASRAGPGGWFGWFGAGGGLPRCGGSWFRRCGDSWFRIPSRERAKASTGDSAPSPAVCSSCTRLTPPRCSVGVHWISARSAWETHRDSPAWSGLWRPRTDLRDAAWPWLGSAGYGWSGLLDRRLGEAERDRRGLIETCEATARRCGDEASGRRLCGEREGERPAARA